MLKIVKFFILILCAFNNNYTNAQVFKAGDIFSGYIDITPDTLINFNYQTSPTENYYFDIDNDAQNDFKIQAYNSGGLGGASRSISIIPINASSYILKGRIDSVFHNYYNDWLLTPMLKVLNYGDSINTFTNVWVNQALYLTSKSGIAGTYVDPTDWTGGNDLYIGLKNQTATDTVYGWIRVNCPYSNKCIVKDYSSTGFYTGIKELNKSSNLLVFPNPTSNLIDISDDQNQFKNSTIQIKNYLGQVVFITAFASQINLQYLSAGMYFLTIQDKSSSKTVKFIKQ